MTELLKSILIWGGAGAILFAIRPASRLHRIKAASQGKKQSLIFALLIILLIALVVFMTTLSPMWNGEIIEHKGQYEMITESFLQGRLDFDLPVDPRLEEMEDPYDPQLRNDLGIEYFHDHAYYHGHYYMYFGVVPVFLAFLPFRLLFGQALLSVHATQWFAALFILGLAAYFRWLVRRKFPQVTLGMYLMLFTLFTLLSLLYAAKFPSLYQTPVACGMMLEIWSIYCFARAVWEERSGVSFLRWAWAGSLLGALTFGCRPPLALANLVLLPLLYQYLKRNQFTARTVGRLALSLSPYLLVAAGLMWYNYARFQNPFEFGQAYQLTTADQHGYGGFLGLDALTGAFVSSFNALFALPPLSSDFPFFSVGCGIFACCPLLLYVFGIFRRPVHHALEEQGMAGFLAAICLTSMVIVFFQSIWSPLLLDRYKSDVLYLMSLGALISIFACFSLQDRPERASCKICFSAFLCLLVVLLLFLVPDDFSHTQYYAVVNEHLWQNITFRPY